MKKVLFTLVFAICMLMALAVNAKAAEAPIEYPYIVKDGSPYFESAYGFGSGRYGIVGDENPYTDVPCKVRLNGYAFLGEHGEVIEAKFEEDASYTDIPNTPEGAICTWVHFNGPVYRNGWVDMMCVYPAENGDISLQDVIATIPDTVEEKSPEEVVEQIEAIQGTAKTAVVLDVSGSMYESQEKVVRQLESMEFEEGTIFEIFAGNATKISEEDFKARKYDIYGGTNLFGALNALKDEQIEAIILISDLCDNYGTVLEENPNIKGVIIYNPYETRKDIVNTIGEAFENSNIIQEVRIR